MLLKNPNLKAERCYLDPDSFVRDDGSEVLKGLDWKERKKQLWERSNGQCEQIIGYDEDGPVRCASAAADPHHIIPRSHLRDDRLSNLKAVCRRCHKNLDERRIGGRSHEACKGTISESE